MAEKIEAEIVANVLKVVAYEGQSLAQGDTVVLLESMKMEIPVITESAGKLTKIAVKEGDVVQEHDLIAVVE
ncbi:acetyl-CoA carboxylase biotin carboxyl carrier protein subunit [Kibdelosporangium aridum]|uniref:Acetyl-CoA carboxylase biotin carboxyl carrier protein subunit n=1 Tax=Kibdelosporangium aridum TaxID=2030 RepID=A0A428YB95_KIBAR|nr:biotin/lipoyl-binding carrier protein [Kibdelosporangium aridum]RSM64857.1 acetyl-CoA carboxylase biotin carboxyl carrier protein subunit [Kibdelosporangium aridum]